MSDPFACPLYVPAKPETQARCGLVVGHPGPCAVRWKDAHNARSEWVWLPDILGTSGQGCHVEERYIRLTMRNGAVIDFITDDEMEADQILFVSAVDDGPRKRFDSRKIVNVASASSDETDQSSS